MLNAHTILRSAFIDAARLSVEKSRQFEEARAWLDRKSACVNRTPMASGEHVAIVLPTGLSAQFIVAEPGDYEEGIVLAVDELR